MTRTWLRGVALAAIVSAAVACGGDDNDAQVEAPTTAVSTTESGVDTSGVATTDGGGTAVDSSSSSNFDLDRTVVYYGTNTLSQWDPTKSVGQANDAPYFTQVYDRLLQLGPDNTLQPALATDWSFSDEGLTLTMSLRDGVTFHDGGAFDAANAVANLNRNRAEGSILAPTLKGIADVVASGPLEIQITLKAADPVILFRLASTSSSMVSPSGLANPDGLTTAPAGSGPFKLVKFDGTTVTLERNDAYWNTEQSFPKTKEIWVVTDDAGRLNGVLSGSASIASARPSQWGEIEQRVESGDVDAYQFGEMGQYAIYLNANSGALGNPDVRKAISMSIDRATLNEALLSGLCPPSSQVVPPGFIGHDDDSADADNFDPSAAQDLLEQVNVEPFTVRAIVADGGLQSQMGEVVKEQLAAIGITVELQPTPLASMRATWREGNHDMMVLQFTPSTPDMISILDNDYLGADALGAPLPDIQALVDAARPLAIGSPEREAALKEISARLFEEPLHVPLCQIPGIYVFQRGLLGVDEIPGHLLSANVPDSRSVIWSK